MSDIQDSLSIERLLEKVSSYVDTFDAKLVLSQAFEIAARAHAGYTRIDGQPYLSHPLAVAEILADWQASLPVLATALLHDLFSPEYSQAYTAQEIYLQEVRRRLGEDIGNLLETMARLNSSMRHLEAGDFYSRVDNDDFWESISYYLQQNRDTVIIKIADRTHNLMTSSALTPHYRERAADIGLNLLVPLLERLGMGQVRREVEDICFALKNGEQYQDLRERCNNPVWQQEIAALVDDLQKKLAPSLPDSTMFWRPASLYSIWQDLKTTKLAQNEKPHVRMGEAGLFVIIVGEERLDCYSALGLLHTFCLPIEGHVRDLIANRQKNGYQSLHTLVKHPSGKFLQVAIRTRAMDMVAEYGITACWRGIAEDFLPRLPEHRTSMEGTIQVFTPKGEARTLPAGATPIDFAYHIHSGVGNHCVDALVNGSRVDLYHPLQNGDQVEIISGGSGSSPKYDWLQHVKTPQALSRIRHWLSFNRREDMLKIGRALLDQELSALALDSHDVQVTQLLNKIAEREHLKDLDELLVSIGVGRHKPAKIVASLKSLRLKSVRSPGAIDLRTSIHVLAPELAEMPRILAQCCAPVTADEIVGYRRSDNVLVIHRHDCPQLEGRQGLVQVKWNRTNVEGNYTIYVEAVNRPGLASEISTLVALSGIDMQEFHARRRPDGVMAEIYIVLSGTTSGQRDRIQKALEDAHHVTLVDMIHPGMLTPGGPISEAPVLKHLPNPYSPGIAIGSRFYGRETEIERIVNLLHSEQQGTAILLWGQRRIGKTSIMLRLREKAVSAFLPVYLDLQGLRDGNTVHFLYRLMMGLSQVLKERITDLPREITVPAYNRLRKDPLGQFDMFMDLIRDAAKQYPFVIMLDEFQCLNTLREEGVSRSAIFNRLRSHSQHGQGIHLILSGGGLLSQLRYETDVTSLFNIAHSEKLGCLTELAVHHLIKDGLSQVGIVTEPTMNLLYQLTAGHPYYLQLLCSMLYDHFQGKKGVITAHIVRQLVFEWIQNADASRFQHLWEGHDSVSAQRNRLILSAIADLDAYHHEIEFSRLGNVLYPVMSEQELALSLGDLTELGVLIHTHAGYTITVDLFTRWLRQHCPLDRLLKEAPRV